MEIIVKIGVHLLEFLFFAGCLGSLIVVIISGVEDIETILQKDVPDDKSHAIHG